MNTIRFYNILKTAGLSVAALIMVSISSRQLPVYVMRGGIIMAAVWNTVAIVEYLIVYYWVYKKDYSKTEGYYAARKKYIWIWAGIVILACLASGRYLSQ